MDPHQKTTSPAPPTQRGYGEKQPIRVSSFCAGFRGRQRNSMPTDVAANKTATRTRHTLRCQAGRGADHHRAQFRALPQVHVRPRFDQTGCAIAEGDPVNLGREAYAQSMLKVRTKGDAFRRSMYIRVFTFALVLFVFVSAVLSGEEAGAIVSGALMALQISILVFYFWLFRRADPSVLEAPIDPAVQMHWRYLRPNKYPYERHARSVQHEHLQDQSTDEE